MQTAQAIAGATRHSAVIRLGLGLVEREENEPFERVLVRARLAIDVWHTPEDLICVTHGYVIRSLIAHAI